MADQRFKVSAVRHFYPHFGVILSTYIILIQIIDPLLQIIKLRQVNILQTFSLKLEFALG